MIYLDNNVVGSLLVEDGCKISIILCCLLLWPSFNMIEYLVCACRHLMAFISVWCLSLSLAIVRMWGKRHTDSLVPGDAVVVVWPAHIP